MQVTGYIITPSTISALVDGRMRVLDKSQPGFDVLPKLLERAKANDLTADETSELERYLDLRKFVIRASHGKVEISDDRVRLNGTPLQGVIVDRLIAQLKAGYDVKPLAMFLDNLMQNPSETARDELYLWLEHQQMPITDDGYFLAFKKVRDDYRSYHDGETDNSIAAELVMPRYNVDPARDNTCSSGYHFCAYEYLGSYYGSSGRVVVCKINPADVVTIPSDYNNAKGRAWRYRIIDEVPAEDVERFFNSPVMTASVGEGVSAYSPGSWDDDDAAMTHYEPSHHDHDDEDNDDYDDRVLAAVRADAAALNPVDETGPPPAWPKKTELRKMLKKDSERSVAKLLNRARSSLQDHLKKIGLK